LTIINNNFADGIQLRSLTCALTSMLLFATLLLYSGTMHGTNA